MIEKISEVDAIGIDNQTGHVGLTISDNMGWNNTDEHLELLQEKLNRYLSFIESDEIYEAYPNAVGRNIDIHIYSKYKIPSEGMDFIIKAEEVIKKAGFVLCCFQWAEDNDIDEDDWKQIL
jgi:hypothetical protein